MNGVQTSELSAAIGNAEVRRLYETLGVTEHPILKLPSVEQVRGALGTAGGREQLIEMLQRRQRRIRNSVEDPLGWGFEAPTWEDADRLLLGIWEPGETPSSKLQAPEKHQAPSSKVTDKVTDKALQGMDGTCEILAIFGGNRAQKTYYAIKRAMQVVEMFPGTRLALCSEKDAASVTNLQTPLVWPFLKPRYGHLNGKRHTVVKINYTQGNGFTDGKVVLPNGSEIYFLTYNQDPNDYEGWEFGAPAYVYEGVCKELRQRWEEENHCKWENSKLETRNSKQIRRDQTPSSKEDPKSRDEEPEPGLPSEKEKERGLKPKPFIPPNIGAVADESMPLKWMQMFARRVRFRKAKVLWTFTPVRGITPAVKELVGTSAVTLESRRSELLPRKNLPDVPEGQMPYVRKCSFQNAYAIYFFTEFNKWGPSPGRSYYDEVKALCAEKESQYVERVAYGFARDSVARAFPKFGSWNMVKRNQLPARGTNYQLNDPAGSRKWFMMWVRVTTIGAGQVAFYIYRDWPDGQTYGEWAVATEREVSEEALKGWDGDPGPAQAGLGYGVTKYKQTMLECERIKCPQSVSKRVSESVSGNGNAQRSTLNAQPSSVFQEWERTADPYHVRRVKEAMARGEDLTQLQEQIAERYVDPRAGKSEHLAEQGGTCVIDEFAEVQVDGAQPGPGTGRVVGPSMDLIPASGVHEDEGLMAVNELLDWNTEQPLVSLMNQPHLFVSEDCHQVRWMFENYTGRAGAKGACKDPADLVRYMALAKLEDVVGMGAKVRAGRGF